MRVAVCGKRAGASDLRPLSDSATPLRRTSDATEHRRSADRGSSTISGLLNGLKKRMFVRRIVLQNAKYTRIFNGLLPFDWHYNNILAIGPVQAHYNFALRVRAVPAFPLDGVLCRGRRAHARQERQ